MISRTLFAVLDGALRLWCHPVGQLPSESATQIKSVNVGYGRSLLLPEETKMFQNPTNPVTHTTYPDTLLRRLLGGMSLFTLLMTIPQVLTIWVGHRAAGVSLLSWSAYLISALMWLWFGIQKHDKNIYLPCVGWIMLDNAVIVGAMIYS
jgi:uncharacterized protein with PQ loop repeat